MIQFILSAKQTQIYLISIIIIGFFACKNNPASPNPTEQATFDDPRSGAALAASFDGNKLVEWPDLDSIKNRRTYNIEMTRAVYLGHLNDVKGYLLYGRAFMENGQVENAADIFSKGILKFENTPDLYQARGESLLKSRQLTAAIDDLWKAGQKMENTPNPKGIIGMGLIDSIADMTLQYKNYLLMGIAFQCNNDFSNADKMFEVCGDFSTNSDLWVRSYYWQYSCYTRSNRMADAKSILSSVNDKMQILPSSKPYLDAMLHYKGTLAEKDFIDLEHPPKNSVDAEPWIIGAYAVGVKALLDKDQTKAIDVFKKILATGYWTLLPYIAAEGEMAHMKGVVIKDAEEIQLNTQEKRRNTK